MNWIMIVTESHVNTSFKTAVAETPVALQPPTADAPIRIKANAVARVANGSWGLDVDVVNNIDTT